MQTIQITATEKENLFLIAGYDIVNLYLCFHTIALQGGR